MTYKIFMIIGVIVVVGGWIAYAIWDYKQRQEEQKQPPQKSQRLQKTQGEIADWAKKMAQFQKPTRKPGAGGTDQSKE